MNRGLSFASWAGSYDDSALQALLFEPAHSSVAEQLRRHAPQAYAMLDVGCGTGRLVQTASQWYSLVVGIDPCQEMLAAGRSRTTGAGPRFACAMAERLPFRTGTFDVVTSTLSLRHWEDPARGLAELARVLARTGTLVIADASPSDLRPAPRRLLRRGTGHVGQLRQMVAHCGLRIVDERATPCLFSVPVLTARHR